MLSAGRGVCLGRLQRGGTHTIPWTGTRGYKGRGLPSFVSIFTFVLLLILPLQGSAWPHEGMETETGFAVVTVTQTDGWINNRAADVKSSSSTDQLTAAVSAAFGAELKEDPGSPGSELRDKVRERQAFISTDSGRYPSRKSWQSASVEEMMPATPGFAVLGVPLSLACRYCLLFSPSPIGELVLWAMPGP
ncbi:unnamed protein product [Arctogadus glacialis]